ncbi:MAG: ABC transporter permease [Armatimonadetes bacterium]|nr:ABC transporter permease [Armatimonadota bacterium]
MATTTHRVRLLRKFLRRRSAVIGAAIVGLVLVTAAFAPLLSRRDPIEQDLALRMRGPGGGFVLGTDDLGRDQLSRIIWGSRITLLVAAASIAFGAVGGSIVGVAAGYAGGRLDNTLMRAMDIMMAFPTLLLAVTLVAVLGPGVANLVLAIGVANVPQFGRIVRGEVLRIKPMEFVDGARALGASPIRIVLRHLLPNLCAALIVMISLRVSVAILSEASLSFLGLGVPPPAPSWGSMVAEGQKHLFLAPWLSILPGLAIMLIVLALNLLGDGVRDALDPSLRGDR